MQEKKRKLLTSLTALVCVAALLVGGTFAWRGVSSALNVFGDEKTETPDPKDPGANLHDDFDAATGDKNIYVENTGDSDVYVRVKLDEVLVKDSNVAPGTPAWVTFKPTNLTNSGTYYNAYDEAFSWTLGNTAPYNYDSIVGSTEWAAAADRTAKDDLVGDALGSAQSGSTIVDLSDGTTADKQAPAGTVITMAEYTAKSPADKVAFIGWVYDEDGYAYWSQPLGKDETTSLLLDSVKIPIAGSETYYYAINATMEYVDIEDLGAWLDGDAIKAGAGKDGTTTEATDDAEAMLRAISAGTTEEANWPALEVDTEFVASGYTWIVIAKDGDNVLVTTKDLVGTSSFNPQNGGNEYAGSILDGVMNDFYNNVLKGNDNSAASGDLKITEVAQPSNYLDKRPGHGMIPDPDDPEGFSSVAESGVEGCFALSYQESSRYLKYEDRGIAFGCDEEDVIEGCQSAWCNGGASSAQCYWLRSVMNTNTTNAARHNHSNSPNNGYSIHMQLGVRPALWINTQGSTVEPTPTPTPEPEARAIGDKIEAGGWEWVVIAIEGDNALVTTTNVIGSKAYGTDKVYVGSTLDQSLQGFYNDLVEYDKTSTTTKLTDIAKASDYATKNPDWHYQTPATTGGLSTVIESGTPTCFALSYQEVQAYLVGTEFLLAKPSADGVADGFGTAFSQGNDGKAYWLRSPNAEWANAAMVNYTGEISHTGVIWDHIAVRPAMWISN